ncbi:MAG TPA: GntR family transcriptional regulator [Polyangiaceae bacterium]|jgi:DNA-binding FadR family transcriptional regulator|nr:GntR family transcriptional regulator [Polyangiaceae bacterium]
MSNESPVSRAEVIAENLRNQIAAGKYAPGDRLPSERELAQRTGANRSSVREAMKRLEENGMIEIRRGAGGARVLPLERAGLGALQHALISKTMSRDFLSQWLDVHELVIAGSTRLAVERATDEELALAKKLLRKLVAPDTGAAEFVTISDQLTELIAVASRNLVLRMVRNSLTAQSDLGVNTRQALRSTRKQLLPIARHIERAIGARDAGAAEEGVRRFLRANRETILDVLSPKRPA